MFSSKVANLTIVNKAPFQSREPEGIKSSLPDKLALKIITKKNGRFFSRSQCVLSFS